MGWIENYQGQTIGLDTAPLIYHIEGNNKYSPIIDPFFQAIDRNEILVVTSTITLMEVLIQPLRLDKKDLVAQYKEILLDTSNLIIVDVVAEIAEIAARLRAQYNIRPPDSIQLATALFMGSTTLLTNDKDLRKVTELEIVLLDDFS